MHEIGRVGAEPAEVELLQDVKNLAYVHAAGTGGWKTDNHVSAIRIGHWLTKFWLITCNIESGEQPAVFFHPALSFVGERAAIKPIDPLLCNLAIGRRQIALLEDFSATIGRTVRAQKDSARFGEAFQVFDGGSETSGV